MVLELFINEEEHVYMVTVVSVGKALFQIISHVGIIQGRQRDYLMIKECFIT